MSDEKDNKITKIFSKEELEKLQNKADSFNKTISLNKNLFGNFDNISKSFEAFKSMNKCWGLDNDKMKSLSLIANGLTKSEFGFKPMELPKIDPIMFVDHKLVAQVQTNNHLKQISEKLDKLPDTEKIKETVLENEENKQLLWLEYNSYQEVILNGVFYIHKCQRGQMNDRLLKFLLENPNQVFTRNELFENGTLKEKIRDNEDVRSSSKETKSFYQFPEDIGISGDLKKLFFGKDLSENTICLTNPITKANMNEARVGYINIAFKDDNKKPKKNK